MRENTIIQFKKIGNTEIGNLTFFESEKDIPFIIKRIYYTYDVPIDTKRGMHAHKKLQQAIWCPYGKVEIILDNGKIKINYLLDSPNKVLIIVKGYWRDMYWRKEGSVLCIAASDYYMEDDYIRNYDEFLELVQKGYWDDEN